MSHFFSPDRWLKRAAALRAEAARMKTPAARAELLRIALAYERLAEHAAAQRDLFHGRAVMSQLLYESGH